MRRLICGLVAFTVGAASSAAQAPASSAASAQPSAQHPSLVVVITIDGFRGDYLTRFGSQLSGGLARLTKGGTWFTNAHQDHAITETAPGHASILSGRFPRSTGITANGVGVADSNSPLLGFSGGLGASPERFQGTELFDWIHSADARSRALSVSAKDRGAILPVGRSKQQVYWYPGDGDFTTSRYYADSLPAWVNRFNARMLPQSYAGKTWTPLLHDSAYKEVDSVSIEGNGKDFVFPHPIPNDPDQAANWVRATPFIDEIVVAMALDGVREAHIGEGPQTDLLAVSLSGTDAVGHRLGPESKEAHDQVLRVDRTIGVFLDSLFRMRDPSRVVVVLSADHGFTPIPELAATMNPRPVRASLAPALAATRTWMASLKLDTLAIDVDQQIVLMDRSAFARSKVSADSIITVFENAARTLPGIRRIDRFRDLVRGDTIHDPIIRRWTHQFPANSNVELVATLTPGSLWYSPGLVSSHVSPYDYDTNVPIIFYGPGITAGRYAEFVRTVDIAPTLAQLLGVKPMEKLDGVPLRITARR